MTSRHPSTVQINRQVSWRRLPFGFDSRLNVCNQTMQQVETKALKHLQGN